MQAAKKDAGVEGKVGTCMRKLEAYMEDGQLEPGTILADGALGTLTAGQLFKTLSAAKDYIAYARYELGED